MSRPLRIGLFAEGEAELGYSVPYLKPEDGGKIINSGDEGVLHTLIRRELCQVGISECCFVHRHPSMKEQRKGKVRVGYSIIDPKYLSQVITVWKPEEVDMIVIVVDSDDQLEQREKGLQKALQTIRDNHLDMEEEIIEDQCAGGLAIKNIETWLLADLQAIQTLLQIKINDDLPQNLELLPSGSKDDLQTKTLLDHLIDNSNYLAELTSNKRRLQTRWELSKMIDLSLLKSRCPKGYESFAISLISVAQITRQNLNLKQTKS